LPNIVNGPAGGSRVLALSSVTGMANGQRYDVRIRANHLDGVSATAYSSTNSCVKTVGAAGMPVEDQNEPISEVRFNESTIQVYPNPNNGEGLNVNITGLDGQIQLELMDATGRIITQSQWNVQGSVNQSLEWNETLPVGMYHLRFRQGDLVQSVKVLVVR
jgi:hypothetical protein